MNRPISALAPPVADLLLRYPWPGNVRELENAMERAVALARGDRLELEDLPEELRLQAPPPLLTADSASRLEDVEREHILAMLAKNGGNQSLTAHQLDIGAATLYRKLKKFRADAERGAEGTG
jgi:transcriptional regulator of acetoin/glycerol metabolism